MKQSKWKQYPHLFANGKFKCKVDYPDLTGSYFITGVQEEFFHIELRPVKGYDDLNFVEISECTLIARKIEGMTDEEWQGLFNTQKIYRDYYTAGGHVEQLDYEEMERIAIENLTIKGFLYLLSIGVYPFSQEDFENDDLEAL